MALGNFARSPQEYEQQQAKRRQQPQPIAPPQPPMTPQGPQAPQGPQGPAYGSVGPGAAAGSTNGMNSTFRERLMAMVAASGGRLKIVSGFRSEAEQTRLWNNAVKKYGSVAAARKWVAPPGRSNHNHGIAADLGGDLQWAHANAAQFGLYFPMGWEPWHVEPAGSRSGKGWTGPKASMHGYTSPVEGYSLQDDPGAGDEDDPRKSLDYQMNVFASLLGDRNFWFTEPQLPDDFSSMPEYTS